MVKRRDSAISPVVRVKEEGVTEFRTTLEQLITESKRNIATLRAMRSPDNACGDRNAKIDAISALTAALAVLRRSAGELPSLVPDSRSALVTMQGRMQGGDWDGARDYAENVPFRDVVEAQEEQFKAVAAEIYASRASRPLGLFAQPPRPIILENIFSFFGMPSAIANEKGRNDLFHRLKSPRFWPRSIDAALYWIAHAAEQSYLTGDLPPQPQEDDFNSALPAALQKAAVSFWPRLVTALGYSPSLPFEIGRFISTKRTIEPLTGLDFALVVYVRLEDNNPRIYTAIVQGKPEHNTRHFMANIHRPSTTHGANHQLRALADKPQTAYYAFYPKNRATSPTSFVPAKVVVERLRSRHPDVALEAILSTNCYISTEADAVDFPTFFSKLMMDHAGHKTMIEAIRDLGSPRPSLGDKARDMSTLLAGRLILVEVGSRIPDAELKPLYDIGFARSADFGRDQSASSPGRGAKGS